jgi:hypothetical protein
VLIAKVPSAAEIEASGASLHCMGGIKRWNVPSIAVCRPPDSEPG